METGDGWTSVQLTALAETEPQIVRFEPSRILLESRPKNIRAELIGAEKKLHFKFLNFRNFHVTVAADSSATKPLRQTPLCDKTPLKAKTYVRTFYPFLADTDRGTD